ncbi:hypothetical protein ACGF0D_41335 [Kitasatospora sp. NPDC048298]|uniref:hypothetical protein n=1 Tax=Kitasatospora sp. NPDC048298 TaxID=3364049 RepID=UPI003720EEB1
MSGYRELPPEELLARALGHRPVEPSVTRWDRIGPEAAEELVRRAVPTVVELHTSGSTGPSAPWRRTRGQLWTEGGMLADLVRADRPQAVLSFAPPAHLYGLLATALLPAVLGLPVCFCPRYGLPAPPVDAQRWLIVAIPWAFPVLLRDLSVLGRPDHVTVLHSTATLPATAHDFAAALGAERLRLVELFGSTETALIAHREWSPDPGAWTLMPDVRFADDPAGPGPVGERPLSVSGPRLALTAEGRPMESWTTDDYVEHLDDRRFLFRGRRHRLIKVNGRRIDLDLLEERLRAALPGTDLACRPVADRLRGEQVELLVAAPADPALVARRTTDCLRELGITIGRISMVDTIDRSEVGKRLADATDREERP